MYNLIFYLFCFMIMFSAIIVVNLSNPVHSIFFLILCFLCSSFLLFMINNEFIAIIFIIIYIGAILVLFLFIIMMLDIKIIELQSQSISYFPIFILLLCIFFCELNLIGYKHMNVYYSETGTYINWVYYFICNMYNIHAIGLFLYTYYSLLFILCSLSLFIATIGAILITFVAYKSTSNSFIAENKKYKYMSFMYFLEYKYSIKKMFSIFCIPHISIIGFKQPVTPVMEGIIDLHNYIFFYLIMVFIVVFWMFCWIIYEFYIVPSYFYDFSVLLSDLKSKKFLVYLKSILLYFLLDKSTYNYIIENPESDEIESIELYLYTLFKNYLVGKAVLRHIDIMQTRKLTEYMLIEIIWTIIPSIILVCIAIPSFALLYAMDEIIDPKLTVKAIGYQWFWSYEYAHTFDVVEFNYLKDSLGYCQRFHREALIYDSIMLSDDELIIGYHRLLEVDKQLILPAKTHIRIIITGADVIHSWAVPSFGIKVDAVPGRLSQVGVYIKYEGVFYGQCSELCGVNHGFMPIVVKVVNYDKFLKWYRHVETYWFNDTWNY